MIKKLVLEKTLDCISKNPEENLPKVLTWLDNFGWGDMGDVSSTIHKILWIFGMILILK